MSDISTCIGVGATTMYWSLKSSTWAKGLQIKPDPMDHRDEASSSVAFKLQEQGLSVGLRRLGL
jgi:hypothetical protein